MKPIDLLRGQLAYLIHMKKENFAPENVDEQINDYENAIYLITYTTTKPVQRTNIHDVSNAKRPFCPNCNDNTYTVTSVLTFNYHCLRCDNVWAK
jgi:hypothetical protein